MKNETDNVIHPKAPAPTKGSSKAVYALVEELGDWVSTEMIIGLTDTNSLRDQKNANLPPAKQVVNALNFLHYSGRFLKKGPPGNESYKIAEFKYFDFRQKQLAEKKSSIALVEYLPNPLTNLRSRGLGSRGPYKKKPTAASVPTTTSTITEPDLTTARPPREDSAAFRQRQTHAAPALPIADPDQMALLATNFEPLPPKLERGIERVEKKHRQELDIDGLGGIDARSVLFGFMCGTFIGCLVSLIVVIGR